MTFESARTDDETTDTITSTNEQTATTEDQNGVHPGMTGGEIAEPTANTADTDPAPAEPVEQSPDEQMVEDASPAEQAGPLEPEDLPSTDGSPTPEGTPAPDSPPTENGEPTAPDEAVSSGQPAQESAEALASAEEAAASGEVTAPAAGESEAPGTDESAEPAAPPKPLDLETVAIRTTTLEKDLETAEHKVSLMNRLTALQDALNNLDASEIRAEIDARLAAVQSAIADQSQERIGLKEAIIAKAEELRESQEWKATSEAFRTMQEELRNIGAAGKELDDPLWERFRQARSAFHERRTAFFAEREKHWDESKAKKEALAAEAEALAEVDNFRDKSSRARAMMDEWKAAGFAGRQAEDALWPQFRGALDRFYERRTAYYEQNRVEKERLAAQAEEIADSTDWKTTAEALRRLMTEWKTLGSAGREHDDPLWERFRGAQQRFYDARSAVFAERETAHKENIARKEELCEQAEEIAGRGDMRGAIQDVIALQAAWKQVGFIPRDKSDELWRRFKAACDAVFTQVDAERQDREQSREQGFRDAAGRKREQYQRLNESIAHDQANINRWRDTISSLGGGGRADQIRNELENRVIEVLMRVRDKQARAEELSNDLQNMEARQQ